MVGVRPHPARRLAASAGWVIGVDLGGTRVRVLAVGATARDRRALSGSAPGLPALPAFLRGVWRRWGLRSGSVRGLVVAARGIWNPAERRAQERRLRGLARRVRVLSDAEAAYHGALGPHAGVLVLAGTGAIALGRDARDRWRRAGGLGPLLGDDGSAFWIGRQWLRAMADADLVTVRRILGSRHAVAGIAALAPDVLRRARWGHRRARVVVAEAQAELADLLQEVTRGLDLPSPVTVSWAGSLMADSRFRGGVWRAARRAGLRITPRAPHEPPVAAAARLASSLGP